MWVMERVEGTESRAYGGIYSELCGLWSELKVHRAERMVVYSVNCEGFERVDGTKNRAYSGIYSELCGLWRELKAQRTGRIVVYRVNCVGYGAS